MAGANVVVTSKKVSPVMAMPALQPTTATEIDRCARATPRPRRHLRPVPALTEQSTHIPEPRPEFLLGLAARAYEVIDGSRGIAQLGALVTVGATRQLQAQRAIMMERRTVYRDHRNCLVGAGRVRTCRISAEILEASVVLHTEHRSHAVAMRLEWAHSRWRACELTVL